MIAFLCQALALSPLRRACLILICILSVTTVPAYAVDYFGKPDRPPQATTKNRAENTAVPNVTLESRIALPEPFRSILAESLMFQSKLNKELRASLSHVTNGGGTWSALSILLAAFLYGVLHAIGPGHGKVVVAGYLLSHRARFINALSMSAVVAATQALVAILLVALLAALFSSSGKQIMNHAASLELLSYAAISLLGLRMLWRVVLPSKKGCDCGFSHLEQKKHAHHATTHQRRGAPSRIEMLFTGIIAGLRPCFGAVLLLLLTLANGVFLLGVAATILMGLGVAITVAAISISAYGLNRAAFAGSRKAWLGWIERALAFLGALIVLLFGVSSFVAIKMGLLVPMVG